MMAQRLTVRAPATSANLGPGFDCLGLALDLWNEVCAEPSDCFRVTAAEGAVPPEDENLVLRAARAVAAEASLELPPVALHCVNRVPSGRGLGSSAAALACGVLLGNELLGRPLSSARLTWIAAALEGHPDNIVPALEGGMRVSVAAEDGRLVTAEVLVARSLRFALFVPDVAVPTRDARAALPATVPHATALFNVARVALLVAALAGGRSDLLKEATRDALHQPFRAGLFPAGPHLIRAALAAGALGACVSGAGPTILAFCDDDRQARDVARAMAAEAATRHVPGQPLSLPLSHEGAHLVPPS